MRQPGLVLALIIALAGALASARADEAKRVAVLDLAIEGDAVAFAEARYLTGLLASAVRTGLPPAYVVVEREAVTDALPRAGRRRAPCDDACRVGVARRLGASYFVAGEVARRGKEIETTLVLRDAATGTALASTTVSAADLLDLAAPVLRAGTELAAALPGAAPARPEVQTLGRRVEGVEGLARQLAADSAALKSIRDDAAVPVEVRRKEYERVLETWARTPERKAAAEMLVSLMDVEKGRVRVPGRPARPAPAPGTGLGEPAPSTPEAILAPFAMSAWEVTQAQYELVMGDDPSEFRGCDRCPVESVTWKEARSYCRRVGGRLPFEAEWEYAAAAGRPGKAPDLAAEAWHLANSDQRTHPVGRKAPNALGLYDLLGNVAEWCADEAGPGGAARGVGYRVTRGGGFDTPADGMGPDARLASPPDEADQALGFRCVWDR